MENITYNNGSLGIWHLCFARARKTGLRVGLWVPNPKEESLGFFEGIVYGAEEGRVKKAHVSASGIAVFLSLTFIMALRSWASRVELAIKVRQSVPLCPHGCVQCNEGFHQ